MSLVCSARLDARGLDVELAVGAGERLALLGPNGAGKSSVLAVLAGILRPDAGRAVLAGRTLYDLPGRRWLAPWDRGVALLAQDPTLFPHLSTLENVAFGPRAAGQSPARARATAARWLAQVEAAELADRKPAQLSGGQAQRVAIARALATEPRLLLLDEPLAALDVAAAPLLRRVLRRVLADRSTILVTHDLLDAVLLADRVVVLDRGRVVESGPTAEVIRRPRSPFTARLAGLNMITGTAGDGLVRTPAGTVLHGVAQLPVVPGEPAVAVFGPTSVSVFAVEPHGSPRNALRVVITELEPRDDQVRVRARTRTGDAFTAEVTAQVIGELDLYPGREVVYVVKATAVTIYPT